jgi:hypothetical protein
LISPQKRKQAYALQELCMECGSLLPPWFETLQISDKPTKAQASLRTPRIVYGDAAA